MKNQPSIYTKLSNKYNLPYHVIEVICNSPFRFANEANAIRNNDKLLYGGLIKINRDNQDLDEHNSERINFDVDFEIDNNGNLMQLFYKVLEICQKIK